MCRGVPGRVIAVDGPMGTVDFWGKTATVRFDLLDEPVAPGDHVLCSLGFAMRRIPDGDVAPLLALYGDVDLTPPRP